MVDYQKITEQLRFRFPLSIEQWKNNSFDVVNYHKHTEWSNMRTPDSATSIPDMFEKIRERHTDLYFSGEHGYQGEWIYCYDLCKKTSDMRFRYSVEAYWVKDRTQKDNTNCHMVLVARTWTGLRKLNYILSMANIDGFYYKPRIDLDLLFTLTPEEVYVTSACVAGWNYEDAAEIWLKIAEHFGDSFFFEYQAHNTDKQKQINRTIQSLAHEHNIQTIIGLDTHVFDEFDSKKRDNILEYHHIRYADEEGWYMDYPDGMEIIRRMREQGVLSEEEIIYSMMNTYVFCDGCEETVLDDSFKIPISRYHIHETPEERVESLKNILNQQYLKEPEDHRNKEHIDGLRYEMGEVEGSGTSDYFLTNYEIINLATSSEYGGKLTTTSRGSAASYYMSKLLGFTTIDRFDAEVPLFPERFITKDRILTSHQMPDIDMNVERQEPFVRASRDLLGEESCYPLLAVSKLGEKAGWKMYASINNISPSVANEVSKCIDKYAEAKKQAPEDNIDIADYIKDKKLLKLYHESAAYRNIVDQGRGHACGFVLFNGDHVHKDWIGYGDVRYEIGLFRCVSESTGNTTLVACIEGGLLDSYGYVKDDFLIVDVVGIINELYEAMGRPVPSVNELREMVDNDTETWKMYADGVTCSLNQCENPGSTSKVMQYKPQNIQELTAFVAAIRPGFKSLLNGFLRRDDYSNGEAEIDELLSDSAHYMLYQESIMKVLGSLGLEMGETYGVIKSISKKKLIGEKKEILLKQLKESWKNKFGNMENFDGVWNVISDAARYSFNCVSGDTVIKKTNNKSTWYKPTVREMYKIMHDKEYAISVGHLGSYMQYYYRGYGYSYSMNENGRVYRNDIIDIVKQPDAMTYTVTTAGGRTVRATENHKFPTTKGIKQLKDLCVGDILFYRSKSDQCFDYPKERISKRTGNIVTDYGVPTCQDPIVSIEPYRIEDVYDIEMNGDIGHNFALDNDLMICNCSHALSMAFDSLYEAWAKAHETAIFYEVTMNHYQKKGDKHKVALLTKEAREYFGYQIAGYEYGADNSKFTVDGEKKLIYSDLSSVKDVGKKAVADLMRIADNGAKTFPEVFFATKNTAVNKTLLKKLITIGYFKKFGTIPSLLKQFEILEYWSGSSGSGRSTIKKADIEALGLDEVDLHQYGTDKLSSGGVSKTQYRNIDWKRLAMDLCDRVDLPDVGIAQRIRYELDVLGYSELHDESFDPHFFVVKDLDTTYSPKAEVYSIRTGEVIKCKVHKTRYSKDSVQTSYKDKPFQIGDVLRISRTQKSPKRRKDGNSWIEVPGQYDQWITKYSVVH